MNLKGKLSYAGPMGPTGHTGPIGPTGPAGKDALATVDNSTIITNSAGALETSVGGGLVDGLVKDKEIVNIDSIEKDVSSIITEDIFNEIVSYGDKLRADVCSNYGISKGCLCNVLSSKIEITPYEENDGVKVVYQAEHINGKWRCTRYATINIGALSFFHFKSEGNSFYSVKNGKTIANLKGQFLPIDNNTIVLNSKAQLTNGAIFNSPFYSRLCIGAEPIGVENDAQSCIRIATPTNKYGSSLTVQGENNTAIGMSAVGSGCIGIGCSIDGNVGGNNSILINAGTQSIQNYNSNCIGIGSSLSFNTDYQTIIGTSNADTYANFVVAIGRDGNQFNALTIDDAGNATFAGTVSPSGADYAEYFEWADGNTESEDRIGYLVALDGNKIKKANTTDEILGIISGSQSVAGDSAEMNWCNKYLKDEFDRIIYDEKTVHHDAIYDKDNVKVRDEYDETVRIPKLNPDYNSELKYVPRSKRKEWGAVGLLGKIKVRYTGELSVGDYITAQNGIAIKSETKTNLRVLEIINDHIARILIK